MSALTSRYARAFADVALGSQLDVNQVLRQLGSVAELMAESRQLTEVLESPAIAAEQKRGLLDAIVSRESILRPVRNFLAVLIDHRRIQFLPQIIRDFEQEMDARLGFAEAEITSARELGDSEKRGLMLFSAGVQLTT